MARDFLSKKPTVKRIGDNDVKFYPAYMEDLADLRDCLEPAIGALGTIFSPKDQDVEYVKRTHKGEDGFISMEDKSSPIDARLAEIRAAQRKEAIGQVFEALTSQLSRVRISRLLMRSMRDEGFSKSPNDDECLEFFKQLDTEVFPLFLSALLEANKSFFRPLADRLPEDAKSILKGSAPVAAENPSPTVEQTETPQTQKIPG